jgi:gluconolactonase
LSVERLWAEEGLLEAPRWLPDGSVLFSNVLAGGVWRHRPDGTVEEVVPKRRGIGGLVPHADGGVVVTGRSVVHVLPDGSSRDLLTDIDGVVGFNDLTTDAQGRVLVGALRFHPFGGEEPVAGEVWRIDAPGEASKLLGPVVWANGIGVSPDGGTVYVCDYQQAAVLAGPAAGGELEELARAPEGASCDGLAVDAGGDLWVALGAGGGIGRYTSGGRLQAVHDAPAEFVSSMSFGGEDGQDLFVTTIGALLKSRADVAGLPVVAASV